MGWSFLIELQVIEGEMMFFSCFAKKRTKRMRLKEALMHAAARKCALLKNPPARTNVRRWISPSLY